MRRSARASTAGLQYHVINRGDARAEVFHKDDDFAAFLRIMAEAVGPGAGMTRQPACLNSASSGQQ